MVEAGFGATVAPLGTAVTSDQLTRLLNASDEPVFALDGDAAGLRAAYRIIDTALPLLEAGKGIRFAILPSGQDPDDMIRAGAAEELRRLISQSAPMVDLLWQRETEGRVLDSPERLAALEKRFNAAVTLIKDTAIKAHYELEARRRLGRLTREGVSPSGITRERASQHRKVAAKRPVPEREHLEAALLVWLYERPSLTTRFRAELEKLPTSNPTTHALRDLLLLRDTLGDLGADEIREIEKLRIRPVEARLQAFSGCQFQGMSSSMRLIL
jgi:DNA primase